MALDAAARRAFMLAVAVLLADIATKAAIVAFVPLHVFHEVTPWFNLGHRTNPGAAFSFLAQGDGWQREFFIIVGVVAAGFVVWLIRRGNATRLETTACATILGGALGNVVDRVFRGPVVDWLDLHWGDWHWPAFNIADIGITLGAGMLVVASIRHGASRPQTRQEVSR